jgi:CheY-like chemotaxis protein
MESHMRVLLIEDNSHMARSIELMLRGEGLYVYTTDCASPKCERQSSSCPVAQSSKTR